MIIQKKHWNWILRLAGWGMSGAIASLTAPALAQLNLTPDAAPGRDLGTRIEALTPLIDQVQGGTPQGDNLFHSFLELNVREGRSLYFEDPGVRNILSRVTGNDPSDILGTLGVGAPGAPGGANLFLINPNGIIFGPNARLDINGSLLATTASAIQLGERGVFSATEPETSTLLRVNPTALFFNAATNPSVVNQSRAPSLRGDVNSLDRGPTGLQLPGNQTLALIGGTVELAGGNLTAFGGRVELAGVDEGVVQLIPTETGWDFRYQSVTDFGDIQMSQAAFVDVSGANGNIHLNARNITMNEVSRLQAGIFPDADTPTAQAGNIEVRATGEIRLSGGSSIDNSVQFRAEGIAGDVILTANTIRFDGESVDFRASGAYSRVLEGARGEGGDVEITANSLFTLTNGALVTVSARGVGDAGNITVEADQIVFDGKGEFNSAPDSLFRQSSALFSAVTRNGEGDGGQIDVRARSLSLLNGGAIIVSTLGEGNAGNIFIQVDRAIFDGEGPDFRPGRPASQFNSSGVYSRAEEDAIGRGGRIEIQARTLSLTNGATVTAATFGPLDAGTLIVNTDEVVSVSGVSANGTRSSLNFDTSSAGDAGILEINAPRLLVLDGATVSAQTFGAGQAGILEVNASESIVVDGRNSRLAFDTLGSGNARGIRLETGSLQVQNQGIVTVSNGRRGTGNPGNLTIFADSIVLRNQGRLVTETRSGRGGNIELNVEELTLLRNNSLISASAIGTADGGNITIETPDGFVIAVLSEDSDIVASADAGDGGAARARAAGVFGFRQLRERRTPESDFTASSVLGVDGIVEIDTEERELEEPELTSVTAEIAQGCAVRDGQTQSEFIVTGRGGLPSSSEEAIAPDAVQLDLVTRAEEMNSEVSSEEGDRTSSREAVTQTQDRNSNLTPQFHTPVVEAQGWMMSANGEVVLTANAPNVASHPSWYSPVTCQASE
ncbi:MAG: S-layer family protein [Leptolyngbyaceae cyanobacterium RM1_405_57]|nr:S-layer family protein [Leptolyngbyaceae cyanobacterium RM1_405_57]